MSHQTTRHARIDHDALQTIRALEARAFAERTRASEALRTRASRHLPNGVPMSWMAGMYRFPPIYITHGEGATFFDADGNGYLDFNVCDLSMTMGFGPKPIVDAVSRAVKTGAHFLLPDVFAKLQLPWIAQHLGPRSGYCLQPCLPQTGRKRGSPLTRISSIPDACTLLANRGIWDSVASAGPQVSFAHTPTQVDHYVTVASEFLAEVTR